MSVSKYKEFKLKDHNYRCVRMVAKTQFHVLRRLLPLLSGLVQESVSIKDSVDNIDTSSIIGTIINNLNSISTEDYDYILAQVLHSVSREDAPGDFQNVLAPNGVPMYEDLNYDLSLMINIMSEVLTFNFSDFFTELPSSLPERS